MDDFHYLRRRVDWTRLGPPELTPWGGLPWKVTPQSGFFANNKKTTRRIGKLYMDDFHDLRKPVDWTWFGPSKLTLGGSPSEGDPATQVFRK